MRLNKKAVAKGQTPNFFVEPDSQIAISSNAKYLLKTYYSKIEGCTGTAGNENDLKNYTDLFNIEHIVKLPSHEVLNIDFLGTQFCDGINAQIDSIVNNMLSHTDRPMLITCQDDIEVKKIAELIRIRMSHSAVPYNFKDSVIIDTNDSGIPEKKIVEKAGEPGKVTISSRMGRGTDIKPNTPEGLFVLRTYPTIPRVTKQELGRQGRNGKKGTCIDIINYEQINNDYTAFSSGKNKDRLNYIMSMQARHLQTKFRKHNNIGSEKWKWLEKDPVLQEKYIKSRTVAQLKHELKKKSEVYLRRKEFLIATLSGNVMDVLHNHSGDPIFSKIEGKNLRHNWLDCRGHIEAAWNIRLAGKAKDNEEIFSQFFDKAADFWSNLCAQCPDLNRNLCTKLSASMRKAVGEMPTEASEQKKHLEAQIEKFEKMKALNTPFKEESRDELNQLKKQLQRIIKQTHPDRAGLEGIERLKLAKDLKKLVEEHMDQTYVPAAEPAAESADEPVDAELSASAKEARHAGMQVSLFVQPKKQSTEFSSLVSFYQKWIEGAETEFFAVEPWISKEVHHAIYEEDDSGLDYLFNAIYSSSIGGSSHRQQARREHLFNALSSLKQPQLYLIPAQKLGEAIEQLSAASSTAHFQNNLICLRKFFEMDMLNGMVPKHTAPEDFKKYGLLLKLSMEIADSNYLDNADFSTTELIEHLCTTIKDEYWKDFDKELLNDLTMAFAGNPQSTAHLSARILSESALFY